MRQALGDSSFVGDPQEQRQAGSLAEGLHASVAEVGSVQDHGRRLLHPRAELGGQLEVMKPEGCGLRDQEDGLGGPDRLDDRASDSGRGVEDDEAVGSGPSLNRPDDVVGARFSDVQAALDEVDRSGVTLLDDADDAWLLLEGTLRTQGTQAPHA